MTRKQKLLTLRLISLVLDGIVLTLTYRQIKQHQR